MLRQFLSLMMNLHCDQNNLVRDYGDYCESLKAFNNTILRDEYLDKLNIKCTNLYPDILIGNNNTFNKYRIENGYLYK